MSCDWPSMATMTPQVLPSKPIAESVYPMRVMVLRTILGMSIHALVVTSPATMAKPVFTNVSTATRAWGSFSISASTTPSEI